MAETRKIAAILAADEGKINPRRCNPTSGGFFGERV
jgi:hypothetical protein